MVQTMDLRCDGFTDPLGLGDVRPELSWKLTPGQAVPRHMACRVQVAAAADDFARPLWDSGERPDADPAHFAYEGPALASMTRYAWRVCVSDGSGGPGPWSRPAFFETGILDPALWRADFITAQTDDSFSSACPLLRREFDIPGVIVSARLYATALGLYALWLNGRPAGDLCLTPGWTSYRHRLEHQTYNVTAQLRPGHNVLSAMVGNGWYRGYLNGGRPAERGRPENREHYGRRTALLAMLRIRLADGSERVVGTDEDWKTAPGPLLMSEPYDGETCDARREPAGWQNAGFDDSDWVHALILPADRSVILPQESAPVRRVETRRPVQLIRTPRGETVLDMGVNMTGRMRFRVRGKSGDRVVLRHGEILGPDGNFYTENLRSARQTVTYILRGGGEEIYEPLFSWQGFRYVCVDAFPGQIRTADFEGVVLSSDLRETGHFRCADPLVNQLFENIRRSQLGNFVDIPTDCPQRDERLGWTADAQLFAPTACLNRDCDRFFRKWLRDLAADQRADGAVPFVVPQTLDTGSYGSAGWGDAAVTVPWTLYLYYGDRAALAEQYPSMRAWVEFIRGQAPDGIWKSGFHFGDWLALDAPGSRNGATPHDLIATAFYARSTELLAKTARVLAKTEDAARYDELAARVRRAYRERFFGADGRLLCDTQTAHALSLHFRLAPDPGRLADSLVRRIAADGGHLTTGFLGTPYLCHALADHGQADTAYALLLRREYPSWLYPVTRGATTVWEHWDGIRPDGTLWSPEMNSFNHYAYGAVGDWLYQSAAGIRPDEAEPGFKHIRFCPHPDRRLPWIQASVESPYGTVALRWVLHGSRLALRLTVPPCAAATLELPADRARDITLAGPPEGVLRPAAARGGQTVCELGPGEYTAQAVWSEPPAARP